MERSLTRVRMELQEERERHSEVRQWNAL
jgi:hypothetical protein